MAQVSFVRWSVDPKNRTEVSVDPARVDCTEFYGHAFNGPMGEFPAATKIIMKNKQEYVVQGEFLAVLDKLNGRIRN